MLRRIGLRRTFLLAALVLGSAACDDESPTLSGEELFPGGSAPVTREVILPAGAAFRALGVFTNYSDTRSVPYSVVANRFGGELSANALFATDVFPATLTYTQDNANRTDTLYRSVRGTLVLPIDSVQSGSTPVTVQVYRAAQGWDQATATWEIASDTGGVRTPWRMQGGTRGELLAQSVYSPGEAGDSLVFDLDSADVDALRDTAGFGIIVSVAEAGSRLQIARAPVLRAGLRPAQPVRDTVITTTISLDAAPSTFVFTPEPPQPAGALAAGGIRSARTLFGLSFPDSVTGCNAAGGECARVALRDVSLNRVSLVLRRFPVSAAFTPLDSTILSVFSVTEPALGRRAPLGLPVLNGNPRVVTALQNGVFAAQSAAVFAPADSVVELDFTSLATSAAAGDSVPTTFALLGGPLVGVPTLRRFDTFGLAAFTTEPRLRIVYTLPVRRPLP